MSTTYHLACLICKDTIWIGQKSALADEGYIYSGDAPVMEELGKFLYQHETSDQNHVLAFLSDKSVLLDKIRDSKA